MISIHDYMLRSKEARQKHLDLSSSCVERGTFSGECRALLAHTVDTTVPVGQKIACCHACHNWKCSNPAHLYWGTYSENRKDYVQSPEYDASAYSKKGPLNPNFALAPWRNSNGVKESWKLAARIFDDFKINGWSHNTYGRGHTFLIKNYGVKGGPAKRMTLRFREGWNPHTDSEWIEDFARMGK